MSLPTPQQGLAWANQTNVHWVGLTFALLLAFGLLVLPRRWAPVTFLALACFIPSGQRVVVLGLDFSFLRIMILFGWLRVVVRREYAGFSFHALDLVLLAWVLVGLIAYTLCHRTPDALIFKLGTAFGAVGLYFVFRFLVRNWVDLDRLALILSLLAVPVCLAFLIERATGRNLFSIFGGVQEFTEVRQGRLRCQGAFSHPILAGCFWAAAFPLIAARFWAGGHDRISSVIGSLCALTIIALTASSTPAMAAGAAILGGCCFLIRRFMAVGRIVLLVGIVGLHLAMNAPVWHLIARFNIVGGSTGWYRFFLIDETIKHFDEWWLLGTSDTGHWGRGLSDVTNQYVLEAVEGGLPGLLLFLGLVVLGFRAVGRTWRSAWPDRASVALSWALGVSLLTQCVSFFGVAFFDQTGILWSLVLACLASMSTASTAASLSARTQPKQRELCEQAPPVAQRGALRLFASPRWFGA